MLVMYVAYTTYLCQLKRQDEGQNGIRELVKGERHIRGEENTKHLGRKKYKNTYNQTYMNTAQPSNCSIPPNISNKD